MTSRVLNVMEDVFVQEMFLEKQGGVVSVSGECRNVCVRNGDGSGKSALRKRGNRWTMVHFLSLKSFDE